MNFNKYVTILKEKLSNGIGFPLSDILTETIIQQALKDEQMKYRERLYTPTITLWTWICQVLNKDKSCKNAVSLIISSVSHIFKAIRYLELESKTRFPASTPTPLSTL